MHAENTGLRHIFLMLSKAGKDKDWANQQGVQGSQKSIILD